MTMDDVYAIIDRELPTLHGWCTLEKGRRLADLATGAHLCVDLGVFGGRSLIAMALTLKQQGFGVADGIDPFTPSAALQGSNDPANDEWWRNLDYAAVARSAQVSLCQLGLLRCTKLVRMTSLEVVEFYEDASVDLLHQDSNHSEEVSLEEVELWAPKISPWGHWVLDDTNWPTTRKAQLGIEARGFKEIEDHGTWKVYRRCVH